MADLNTQVSQFVVEVLLQYDTPVKKTRVSSFGVEILLERLVSLTGTATLAPAFSATATVTYTPGELEITYPMVIVSADGADSCEGEIALFLTEVSGDEAAVMEVTFPMVQFFGIGTELPGEGYITFPIASIDGGSENLAEGDVTLLIAGFNGAELYEFGLAAGDISLFLTSANGEGDQANEIRFWLPQFEGEELSYGEGDITLWIPQFDGESATTSVTPTTLRFYRGY